VCGTFFISIQKEERKKEKKKEIPLKRKQK
jgi:hypothetical protein